MASPFNTNPAFKLINNSRKRAAVNQQIGASSRQRVDASAAADLSPPIIASAPILNAPRPVNAGIIYSGSTARPAKAKKKRIRPAPKPKQTIDNLPPHIRSALTAPKDAYDKVMRDFEDEHKAAGGAIINTECKVSGAGSNTALKVNLNVSNASSTNTAKTAKYSDRAVYSDAEYDDLYEAMKTAMAMGYKLGDSYWKMVTDIMGSTRSPGAYRNRFGKLASGKLKGKYRNSEFCALQIQLNGFKSEHNCVSSLVCYIELVR